jgi:hypothetical protein
VNGRTSGGNSSHRRFDGICGRTRPCVMVTAGLLCCGLAEHCTSSDYDGRIHCIYEMKPSNTLSKLHCNSGHGPAPRGSIRSILVIRVIATIRTKSGRGCAAIMSLSLCALWPLTSTSTTFYPSIVVLVSPVLHHRPSCRHASYLGNGLGVARRQSRPLLHPRTRLGREQPRTRRC